MSVKSIARPEAEKRWEVLNDGKNRWVLVDNWSDDPCPVYETEAQANRQRQLLVDSLTDEPHPTITEEE